MPGEVFSFSKARLPVGPIHDDANSKSLDSYNLFRKTENKNMGERDGEISMGRAHLGYCVHIDANHRASYQPNQTSLTL